MKKLAVIAIVVLSLVIVSPVLAYWEWHTGDACMWYRGATPSCDANGIVLPGTDFEDNDFPVAGTMAVSEQGELQLETTCQILVVVVDGVPWSSGEITVSPGDQIVFMNMAMGGTCYISSVEIGEEPQPTATPEPTATAQPSSGGSTLDIDTTDVLSYANMVVQMLMPIVIITSGFSLGFGIVQKIGAMFSF